MTFIIFKIKCHRNRVKSHKFGVDFSGDLKCYFSVRPKTTLV